MEVLWRIEVRWMMEMHCSHRQRLYNSYNVNGIDDKLIATIKLFPDRKFTLSSDITKHNCIMQIGEVTATVTHG